MKRGESQVTKQVQTPNKRNQYQLEDPYQQEDQYLRSVFARGSISISKRARRRGRLIKANKLRCKINIRVNKLRHKESYQYKEQVNKLRHKESYQYKEQVNKLRGKKLATEETCQNIYCEFIGEQATLVLTYRNTQKDTLLKAEEALY